MSHRAYDSKKGAWYYEVNELATGSVVRFWHQKKIMYLRDKVALKFIQYRKRVQVKSITLLEREYYANHVKPSKRHRFNHSSVVERTIE